MSFWVRLPGAAYKAPSLARDLNSALLIAQHLRATSTPFKADLFVLVQKQSPSLMVDELQANVDTPMRQTQTLHNTLMQMSTFRSTMQTDICVRALRFYSLHIEFPGSVFDFPRGSRLVDIACS